MCVEIGVGETPTRTSRDAEQRIRRRERHIDAARRCRRRRRSRRRAPARSSASGTRSATADAHGGQRGARSSPPAGGATSFSQLISAPAWKCLPAPRITRQRTDGRRQPLQRRRSGRAACPRHRRCRPRAGSASPWRRRAHRSPAGNVIAHGRSHLRRIGIAAAHHDADPGARRGGRNAPHSRAASAVAPPGSATSRNRPTARCAAAIASSGTSTASATCAWAIGNISAPTWRAPRLSAARPPTGASTG